jgi:hypothetical protein
MGSDIHEICDDVKDLVEYAVRREANRLGLGESAPHVSVRGA